MDIRANVFIMFIKGVIYIIEFYCKSFDNFLGISRYNNDFICVIATLFNVSNRSACLTHIFISSAIATGFSNNSNSLCFLRPFLYTDFVVV